MRRKFLSELTKKLLTLPQLSSLRLPAPGLTHYRRETPEGVTRFHLRVDPDGSGLLLCNAAAVIHLNATGVVMAKALLEGSSPEEVLNQITGLFHSVPQERIREDIHSVETMLNELIQPEGYYPVMNLGEPALTPRSSRLMAPFQAGITLAEPERIKPILNQLWEIGIPHINFRTWTTFDPEHLFQAVERAEDIGMVAGARIVAGTMGEQSVLERLVTAGLDNLMVPVASTDATVHDALYGAGDHAQALSLMSQAKELGTCAMAEFPLIKETMNGLEPTVQMLAEEGITNVSFFAIAIPPEIKQEDGALTPSSVLSAAALVEEIAQDMDVHYFWQPVIRRDPELELLEQVRLGPRATGDVSIRVEPDGSVFPPRGPRESAGNLLNQPWSEIWQHEAFRRYRERVEANTRCQQCPDLVICSVDCPKDPAGWAW